MRKQRAGFSLIEVSLYVGLLAAAGVALTSFFTSAQKATSEAENAAVSLTEQQTAGVYLNRDLRGATPSFHLPSSSLGGGNLMLATNGKPFYSFDSRRTCVSDCMREFFLEPGADPGKFFYLATLDRYAGTPVALNPLEFYDSREGASLRDRGSLNFNPVTMRSALNANPEASFLLSVGEVSWFYSPVGLREQNTADNYPRFYGLFVERLESGEYSTRFPFLPKQPHPALSSIDFAVGYQGFSPIDSLLRLLPPVGGTSVVLMAAPVVFYRYSVRNDAGGLGLFRERYRAGGWEAAQILAAKVNKVVFRRDIRKPSIQFDVVRASQRQDAKEGG